MLSPCLTEYYFILNRAGHGDSETALTASSSVLVADCRLLRCGHGKGELPDRRPVLLQPNKTNINQNSILA